jgi:hypothetical protein
MQPAWLGVPAAVGAALQAAQKVAEQALQVAENAAKAASGTPGGPAARAAAEAAKGAAAAAMGSAISGAAGGGSSMHGCTTPWPVPPHGPGVVIDGSATVQINFLPACRLGDTIIEAIGPPNKITKGETTVVIGG